MAHESVNALLQQLQLRVALRSASHTETLAAADISAGTDTGRKITIRARGNAGEEFVVVTRLQTQGIRPNNLVITAKDLNRHNFAMPLPPSLVIDDVPLIGDVTEGVQFVIRNNAAKAVDVTFTAIPLTKRQKDLLLAMAMPDEFFDALHGSLRNGGRA